MESTAQASSKVRPPRLPPPAPLTPDNRKAMLAPSTRERWYLSICELAHKNDIPNLIESGYNFVRFYRDADGTFGDGDSPDVAGISRLLLHVGGAAPITVKREPKSVAGLLNAAWVCLLRGDVGLSESYTREAKRNGASDREMENVVKWQKIKEKAIRRGMSMKEALLDAT